MFAGKAGAYSSEAPFMGSTVGLAPESVFLVMCDPSMNELWET